MNTPFLKSALAFAVLSALAVQTQAEVQSVDNTKELQESTSSLEAPTSDAVKLNTIVVTTAGGYEQNIADAAATISVITSEELAKKSYSDVTDALKMSRVFL